MIQKQSGKGLLNKSLTSQGWWMFYILPALLIYCAFLAFPLVNSMRLSFFSGSGFILDDFVGFENYKTLFFNPRVSEGFWGAFGHTWVFFIIHMFVQNTLGLLFAVLLLSKGLKGREAFRTVIFIPATLAILVTGFLWKLILNPKWGAINFLLREIGLESLAMSWLGNEALALPIISLVSSWQWVGLPTMMFLAGLQNIPDELFEAASIAGANRFQVFRSITLPMLMPVIGIVTILTFTGNFNAFDVVFAMAGPNGSPDFSTDILGTYFYRVGIAGKHPNGIPDMGLGAAVATVTFIILFVGVTSFRLLTDENSPLRKRRRA